MKNTLKNNLIIGLILSSSFVSHAQEEKYVILDSKVLKELKKEKKPQLIVDNSMVFKFDPTRMILGEIDFGFEKKIGTNTSLEIDLGPTISKLGGSSSHYNPYYYSNGSSYYNERSAIGVFSSVGCRFYPKDGVFNGFYINPKFKYKLINSQFVDESGVLPVARGSKNQYSFMFNMGFQNWVTENFSLDLYAGFGMGYDVVTTVSQYSVYDPYTYTNTSTWKKNTFENAKMVFNLGVKVGIGK